MPSKLVFGGLLVTYFESPCNFCKFRERFQINCSEIGLRSAMMRVNAREHVNILVVLGGQQQEGLRARNLHEEVVAQVVVHLRGDS